MSSVIVDTAPELCQKGDFFLYKGWKAFFMFWEFMLTLNKCKESEGRAFCIVIQAFNTVRIVLCFGCSGSVIGSLTAYILI